MIRLLATYIFILSSCSSSSNINKKPKPLHQNTIAFETLAQDFYGGMVDSKSIVINDETSLNNIYNLISKDRTPKLEIPEINFNKETVIALFLGEKNSGGYSINVEQIMNVKDKVNVVYKITSPKAGEMVTSVMTQPYCIVKIPKTLKEIVFSEI